jgi:hypothetical protein
MEVYLHASTCLRGVHRKNFAFTRENSMKLTKLIDVEQAKTVCSAKNIKKKLKR